VSASYGPVSGSVNYSFTHFDPSLGLFNDQQSVASSLSLKVTTNWTVTGTSNYNITTNQRIQDLLQVKYAMSVSC